MIASTTIAASPPKDKRKLGALFPPVPTSKFNFAVAAGRLVPLPAAALLLNRARRDVLALIEEGRLRWAFDVRAAGRSRGEIRVLGQSIMEFAGLCPADWVRRRNEDEEFLHLIKLVLPPGFLLKSAPAVPGSLAPAQWVLRGSEVVQCFSCSPDHVHNLIAEKSLETTTLRSTLNSTPLITRDSVVKFLKSRRVV
jgi:hypothetical protein